VEEEAARNLEQEKANLIYTTQTSATIAARRATIDTLSFSVPGPTRLISGLWRASQNREEDSQASSIGLPPHREAPGDPERDCPQATTGSDIL
jgi:hypothetical protein